MELRPLPPEAQRLCVRLNVSPRLLAHLTLVHHVSADIIEGMDRAFPGLALDRPAVLFGAATHDLGKVLHPNELTGPGDRQPTCEDVNEQCKESRREDSETA